MLRREESHFLDFKRASITPGKLQETVVALANADGGELIIGLDGDIRRSPVERFHGFRNPEHANNYVELCHIDRPTSSCSIRRVHRVSDGAERSPIAPAGPEEPHGSLHV